MSDLDFDHGDEQFSIGFGAVAGEGGGGARGIGLRWVGSVDDM